MHSSQIRNTKAARLDGIIVELWFLAVVTGLVMALAWHVLPSSKPVTQTPLTVEHLAITDMVSHIKSDIAREVPSVKTSEGAVVGRVGFKFDGYDYASLVESKDFAQYEPTKPILNKDEATTKRETAAILKPALAIITDTLVQNGFAAVIDPKPQPDDGDKMYQRDDSVCIAGANYAVDISCASKQQLKQVADDVKPFVAAYRAAKQDEDAHTAYGMLETGTGKTKNDKYAAFNTNQAQAYFYEKNSTWVYYGATLEALDCPDPIKNPLAAAALVNVCLKPGDRY